MRAEAEKNVRFNFVINTFEAGFFGFGLGFASYVTVIPLFVANLTESSIVIGLISAMRIIGWQFPQLFTANRVARLRRYKPMSLFMTLHERLPFFGLALVALAVPTLGKNTALILTFILIVWQSIGGGLTGTPWQSMIAKIIPPRMRGRFFGVLNSSSNLLSGLSAVLAGVILTALVAPQNFALCFFLAGSVMMIGFLFLASVREEAVAPARETSLTKREFWQKLREIMGRDRNFRLYISARIMAQIASIGLAFFTIYAVRDFQMDAGTAGVMTGVLLISQLFANPIFGWLGDRYSHRLMFAVGVLLAGASAAVAVVAPSLGWFYLVFALAGISNAGLTPSMYALTVEFGTVAERPFYIGLSNTLVAPATLLAPIIGGWLADTVGFQVTFALAAICGVLTALGVVFIMRDPTASEVETLVEMEAGTPHVEPS